MSETGKPADGPTGEKALTARDFQPVKDPQEALELLRESAKSLASALAWTRNQESVMSTYFMVFSEVDKLLYAWIPKDVDPKAFAESVARTGENACYFSVSLAKASIFFKALFAGYDDGGFKFRIPDHVFKVQRRKDMRYTVPEGYFMKVEFDDPLLEGQKISRKVIDLSAGGLALWISDLEDALFPAGTILKNLTFTINKHTVKCDGEVRHLRELPGDALNPRGFKVGISFQKLLPADAQFISKFVFDETRRQFSQMV